MVCCWNHNIVGARNCTGVCYGSEGTNGAEENPMTTNVRRRPDGSLHLFIGNWITDILLVVAFFVFVVALRWDFWSVVYKLILIFAGSKLALAFVSPDVDLVHSTPLRAWGWLSFIWYPYRAFVSKKHRGVMSHGLNLPFGWLLGTFARMIYLSIIALGIALIGNIILDTGILTEIALRFMLSEVMLYLLIGVGVADMIHTRLDLLTTKKRGK